LRKFLFWVSALVKQFPACSSKPLENTTRGISSHRHIQKCVILCNNREELDKHSGTFKPEIIVQGQYMKSENEALPDIST